MTIRPKKGSVVVDIETGCEYMVQRMTCSDKMLWGCESTYYEIKEMIGSATFAVSYSDMIEDFEVKK